jgi:hypothetical protein
MRRLRQAALVLATASIGALASCSDDPPFPFDDAACETAMKGPDAVNAIDWLKDPYGGPKRVGTLSNDEALALALKIQSLGVNKIVAVGIHPGATAEPSQAAMGLVAALPPDLPNRRALFELQAGFARAAGYSPRADRGQKYLFFAWKT